MSYIEYGFKKADEWIFAELEKVANDHPNAARLCMIPLAIYEAITFVVRPVFELIEEFFWLLVTGEGKIKNLFDYSLNVCVVPIIVPVKFFYILIYGLYDPLKCIQSIRTMIETDLNKDKFIKVQISLSSFSEELANTYCTNHNIEDDKARNFIIMEYESLRVAQVSTMHSDKYMTAMAVYDYLKGSDAEQLITDNLLQKPE